MDSHGHVLLSIQRGQDKASEDHAAGRAFNLIGLQGAARTAYRQRWQDLTGEFVTEAHTDLLAQPIC